MPGTVLHLGATVNCAHGGSAMPTSPVTRVSVDGEAVTTQSVTYTVAGCSYVYPAPGPCVSAMFTTASERVTADGEPLLLIDSMASCTPTGTPLLIASTQTRVNAG